MRTLFTVILFLTTTSLLDAQQTTILTNTTIIDGSGNAPQPHTAMIIQNGRITKISRGKIIVPDGAVQIDMTGKYLMPQLISCHSHVGNVRDTLASSNNYTRENVLRQLKQYED
jgi:imidazolonepropionase-like amidohydrolase